MHTLVYIGLFRQVQYTLTIAHVVKVQGVRPVCCISKRIHVSKIVLKSYACGHNGEVVLANRVECSDENELASLLTNLSPTEPCALLRAVLVILGMGSNEKAVSFRDLLGTLCGGGFEISSFSGLPGFAGFSLDSVHLYAILNVFSY